MGNDYIVLIGEGKGERWFRVLETYPIIGILVLRNIYTLYPYVHKTHIFFCSSSSFITFFHPIPNFIKEYRLAPANSACNEVSLTIKWVLWAGQLFALLFQSGRKNSTVEFFGGEVGTGEGTGGKSIACVTVLAARNNTLIEVVFLFIYM